MSGPKMVDYIVKLVIYRTERTKNPQLQTLEQLVTEHMNTHPKVLRNKPCKLVKKERIMSHMHAVG